jgi:hypothetical protein
MAAVIASNMVFTMFFLVTEIRVLLGEALYEFRLEHMFVFDVTRYRLRELTGSVD